MCDWVYARSGLERFFVLPPEEAREFLPSAEEACADLAQRFETLLAGLDRLRHHLWETIDKPDREEAPLRVLEDDSVEGARLVRHQMSAISTLQRSIAAVKKLQKSEPRRAVEVRQNEPNPAPAAAQNEPISAPAMRQNEPISPRTSTAQAVENQGVKLGKPAPAPARSSGLDSLLALMDDMLADPRKYGVELAEVA